MPGATREQGRISLPAIHYILIDLNQEERSRASFIPPVTFSTELILEKANLQYTLGKAHVNQKNHLADRNYPGEVIENCGLRIAEGIGQRVGGRGRKVTRH